MNDTMYQAYLVSKLTGSGDSDGAGPVVVEMGQLVGQLLDVLRLEAAAVLHHVVASGVDCPLPHRLADQEEIVPKVKLLPGG